MSASGGCKFAHYRCNNGSCIPNEKVCNIRNDCGDLSDERCGVFIYGLMTANTTKEKNFGGDCLYDDIIHEFRNIRAKLSPGIRCPPSAHDGYGNCVNRDSICNKLKDCPDGLDEARCGYCQPGSDRYGFLCRNGRCIESTKVCDHFDDCGDGSDEKCEGYLINPNNDPIKLDEEKVFTEGSQFGENCTVFTEFPTFFGQVSTGVRCAPSVKDVKGKCIDRFSICNGTRECSDGFDETRCGKHFGRTCIQTDGRKGVRCPLIPGDIRGECIHRQFICDWEKDCHDGFDENNCDGCPKYQFRCSNGSCVDNLKVCDHRDDCGDRSDEMCVCGQSDKGRLPSIVNGVTSDVGQWPWQVALSRREDVVYPSLICNDEGWCVICGGSLLSESWVVTAAHCVTEEGTNIPMGVDHIRLYLGKHFRDDRRDDELVQVRQVREIHVHENYNPRTLDSDIALLQLERPVQLSSRIQTVCLPKGQNLFDGKEGVVTGWGDLYGNKTFSPTLQQVVLPVVLAESCRRTYKMWVTDNMFCAGLQEGSRDGCEGDSGGPMVFQSNAPGCQTPHWELGGIVSWGSHEGCASPGQYGGFTAVYRFLDWIRLFI